MSFGEGPFGDLKVPLAWTAAVALIVALVAAGALLLADRRETLQTKAYGGARQVFDTVDRPVASALSKPGEWLGNVGNYIGSYFFAVSENRKLRAQVEEMRRLSDYSVKLADDNTRLRATLGLRTDPPVGMATGRAVLDSRGPYANTRLINVGAEAGVRVGNPVMNERGLIGRIIGVSHGASRVLLLSDLSSRTPVLVDRTDARSILTGDGGPNPRLAYMRGRNPVREGDRILTSGDGGVFPRGLPVGRAAKGLDGQWRVRLDADLTAIDYVRVLKFLDFTELVDVKALEQTSMPPPLNPGAVAQAAARLNQPARTAPANPAGRTAASPGTSASGPATRQTAAPRPQVSTTTPSQPARTPPRAPAATPAPAPAAQDG